jgi:hypothetical protein
LVCEHPELFNDVDDDDVEDDNRFNLIDLLEKTVSNNRKARRVHTNARNNINKYEKYRNKIFMIINYKQKVSSM